MWEWGKLKVSDAFQKAHLMPPSGFRWYTVLPLIYPLPLGMASIL